MQIKIISDLFQPKDSAIALKLFALAEEAIP